MSRIWDLLDLNHDGQVYLDEFVSGVIAQAYKHEQDVDRYSQVEAKSLGSYASSFEAASMQPVKL